MVLQTFWDATHLWQKIISSLATYLLKKGKVSFFFDIGFILEILSAISYSVL